jgi:hypothetical protein
MEKYRIRKADQYNWVTEQHQAGGGIAKRGRTAGQPMAERWKITGHFTRLKYAASYVFDCLIGDEAASGKELREAIDAAEARLEAAIDKFEKPDFEIQID